jgi:hypothetical protein
MYRLASAVLAHIPLIFVLGVIVAKSMGVDPKLTPEEKKRLIEAISKSEWARALAAKMATTPEAQEMIARRLAEAFAESVERML